MRTEEHLSGPHRTNETSHPADAFLHGHIDPAAIVRRQLLQVRAAQRRLAVQQQQPQIRPSPQQFAQRLDVDIGNLHQRMLDPNVVHAHHQLYDQTPTRGQVQ